MSDFFGLTPQYRNILFSQIHDLVYHGGGGFIHSEIYNMPIWLRRFHINKISEWNKEQNEEAEQARKGKNKNELQKPNITPAEYFNFKK